MRDQDFFFIQEMCRFFLEKEAAKYYRQPYGEKFKPEHISVGQSFKGSVRFKGNYDTYF